MYSYFTDWTPPARTTKKNNFKKTQSTTSQMTQSIWKKIYSNMKFHHNSLKSFINEFSWLLCSFQGDLTIIKCLYIDFHAKVDIMKCLKIELLGIFYSFFFQLDSFWYEMQDIGIDNLTKVHFITRFIMTSKMRIYLYFLYVASWENKEFYKNIVYVAISI